MLWFLGIFLPDFNFFFNFFLVFLVWEQRLLFLKNFCINFKRSNHHGVHSFSKKCSRNLKKKIDIHTHVHVYIYINMPLVVCFFSTDLTINITFSKTHLHFNSFISNQMRCAYTADQNRLNFQKSSYCDDSFFFLETVCFMLAPYFFMGSNF